MDKKVVDGIEPHDKTNKMSVRQQRQISLGFCPVWSVFAVRPVGS